MVSLTAAAVRCARCCGQVPPDVRTGEDAVRLFSSSAAKAGLIIYCNINPASAGAHGGGGGGGTGSERSGSSLLQAFAASAGSIGSLGGPPGGGEYNPYDLLVVDRSRVDPRHHYLLTQSGVTQMLGGHAQELQPFHAWQRERDMFTILRKLVFFKHNYMFQVR